MTHPDKILKAAQSAPNRSGLPAYREAIVALRDKGYTWREVADFLREQGVATDHTTVYRFMRKEQNMPTTFVVPPAAEYAKALVVLDLSPNQKAMLRAHYLAPNRTITYTELANEVGYETHGGANRWYGGLGRQLGEKLGMNFAGEEDDDPFFSSPIGMGSPYTPKGDHFQFVMHHELAKAIAQLGWFE